MIFGFYNKYSDTIYKIMFMLLVSVGVLFACSEYMGIQKVTIVHYCTIILSAVYIMLIECASRNGKIAILAGTAFLLFMVFVKLKKENEIELFYEKRYILWIFLATLAAFTIVSLWNRFRTIKFVCIIAIVLYIGTLIYLQRVVPRPLICCTYLLLFIIVCDVINRQNFVVSLLPLWIIIFILFSFTKESEKPYEWTYVKDTYYSVRGNIENIIEKFMNSSVDDYIYSMSGYGESSKVGDKASNSKQELMTITSDIKMPCNMYLTGAFMDEFDGREWKDSEDGIFTKKSDDELNKERLMDMLETLYAIDNYNPKMYKQFIVKNSINTEYRYFNTFHTFTTSKAVIRNNENAKKKVYGDNVKSTCFQIYAGKEAICELIENRQEDSEFTWNNTCKKNLIDGVSLQDYVNYRRETVDKYSKDVELSDGVKAWVSEVTKGAETKEERLFAIQDAMRQFTYTTDVDLHLSEIKNESEFLDYFLLEKKEGYCTYYATAFTLLARAEGYPARYAQGFYVPMKGKYSTTVVGKMAHAWSEVYFEGVGWIPFENTPCYEGVAYEHVDYSFAGGVMEKSLSNEEDMEQAEDEKRDEELRQEEQEKIRESRRIIFISLGFVALVIVIGKLVSIILSRVMYKKKSLYEKYVYQARKNINLLSKIGVAPFDGETLEELNLRVGSFFEGQGAQAIDFIPQYEAVIYGGAEVNEEMLATVCSERKKMIKYLPVIERIKLLL